MAVSRADWEKQVVEAIPEQFAASSALLTAAGVEIERVQWSGTDPDTELRVKFRRRGERFRRSWRLWSDLAGLFQPVPHPVDVARQVVVDLVTTPTSLDKWRERLRTRADSRGPL